MFGLSGEKLLILGLIAAFVLGPERLPYYAQQFAKLIKQVKRFADGAKDQLSAEVGEELDWKKLDPRQYDPRRIIREALIEDSEPAPFGSDLARSRPMARLAPGQSAPFDPEAT